MVDSEVVFTADASSDIREGKVAATDSGVVTGTAFIPNYNTYQGCKLIPNGSAFVLGNKDNYDYTELQAIFCNFNTSLTNSVSADYIAIENQVFAMQSTEALSTIIKDAENASINFGITNTSGGMKLLRYFMYKELY